MQATETVFFTMLIKDAVLSLFIPSQNFCWINTVQVLNYFNHAVHKRIWNTQSWIEVCVQILKNTIIQVDKFQEIQQMLVFSLMTAASRPENCKAKLWISQERAWNGIK